MAVLALDESSSSVIGPITLGEKCAGKRSAGNPHAAFEAAGTGNGATARPMRARRGKPRIQTRMILTGHRASPRLYWGRRMGHRLSCAFPAYLYAREQKVAEQKVAA